MSLLQVPVAIDPLIESSVRLLMSLVQLIEEDMVRKETCLSEGRKEMCFDEFCFILRVNVSFCVWLRFSGVFSSVQAKMC
ncbi:hypothetical protein MtrunA17_Chr8g0375051 [Medicago truncatula]|uniref:Uncharacterized protein n=1 Tax=Medicago truncatula TaxID=3880 RepID=A0A396GQ29_MEDTR|nr:hypothetical protein MtrunA17_Chr8g0375051 [Medicago truncatula]